MPRRSWSAGLQLGCVSINNEMQRASFGRRLLALDVARYGELQPWRFGFGALRGLGLLVQRAVIDAFPRVAMVACAACAACASACRVVPRGRGVTRAVSARAPSLDSPECRSASGFGSGFGLAFQKKKITMNINTLRGTKQGSKVK